MNGLIMAGQLILGLSILVVLHELGHFLAARAFGMRVDKFYLFFDAWGVKLFKFKYKDCEYGIGWLPLGGYVKISGMIDESMDLETLKSDPQPWEFRAKPAWQRLIVMLGGIIVNVIAGVVIFWMLVFNYGETRVPMNELKYGISTGIIGKEIGLKDGDLIKAVGDHKITYYDEVVSSKLFMGSNQTLEVLRGDSLRTLSVPNDILNRISDLGISEFVGIRTKFSVDSVLPGSEAFKAGLKKGDVIKMVNSTPIFFFDEIQKSLQLNKGKKVNIIVWRSEQEIQLKAEVSSEGKLGFVPNLETPKTVTLEYSFLNSLPIGASKAWGVLADNLKGLKKIIIGEVKATKALNSPIGIAKVYGATFDWVKFWSITGLISMALALMNLLPIPALDGGHVVFLIIEIFRGKPVSDKVLEKAQMVGMILLISLMVFTIGNDIFKIFLK